MNEIVFEFPEVPQINFLIDLQGASLYTKWLELGNEGTMSDFLHWLKGKGDDGETPAIGENGNWWIAGVDSGLPSRGQQGEPLLYSDLTPEQIAELQQPAIDAAALVTDAIAEAEAATDNANTAAVQLVDGAETAYNTFKKLQDKIKAVEAVIGVAADNDDLINTVNELLAVFSTFPEGSDMATLLTAKVNVADIYNGLDCIIEGKVADARAIKSLKDAVDALLLNYEPKKSSDENYVSTAEKSTWNAKQPAGDYATNTAVGLKLTTPTDTTVTAISDADLIPLIQGGVSKAATYANYKLALAGTFAKLSGAVFTGTVSSNQRFSSTGSDLLLSDSGGNIFRGVRSNSWSDSKNARFFQVGGINDYIWFTSQYGAPATRLSFSSLVHQFSTSNYEGNVPTGIFEVTDGTAPKFNILSTFDIRMLKEKYLYQDTSPTSDTLNDTRFRNSGGVIIYEVCTVGNAAKGGGTWVEICRMTKSGFVPTKLNAAPTGTDGGIYFNSTDKHFYGYDGTTWKQLDN